MTSKWRILANALAYGAFLVAVWYLVGAIFGDVQSAKTYFYTGAAAATGFYVGGSIWGPIYASRTY